MRKLTLADCLMATLAVGIMIGFPVWYWIIRDALKVFKAAIEAGEITGFRHGSMRAHGAL